MTADDIVVSTPLRTAIGTLGGQLKDTPAVELGATIVAEVLTRAGLKADQVDQVIVGNVLQAGQGQAVARARRRNTRYGLVTLCIDGGMGIAAIFERAN